MLTFIDNVWGTDLADIKLNLIKDLHFYYVLLIFITKMHGLFFRR